MCSSMLLVVQSTIVVPSIVRGSAPSPTTISLLCARSCAPAADVSARISDSTTGRLSARMDASGRSDSQLRVERVAQPVAEQVHAQRGEREGETGKGHEPPRDVEEVAA